MRYLSNLLQLPPLCKPIATYTCNRFANYQVFLFLIFFVQICAGLSIEIQTKSSSEDLRLCSVSRMSCGIIRLIRKMVHLLGRYGVHKYKQRGIYAFFDDADRFRRGPVKV